MKKRIVFIDDDDTFEIPLFRKALEGTFDIVTGVELEPVRTQIAGTDWKPDLFVLDLYFPLGIPDEAALANVRSSKLEIIDDQGNMRAAYANFQTVKVRLTRVLHAWNQGPDGGLDLAKRVAKEYPDVPIVFYSRKATPEDVVRCMTLKNVCAVEIKPTGSNYDEIEKWTIENSGQLAIALGEVIENKNTSTLKTLRESAKVISNFLKPLFDNPRST